MASTACAAAERARVDVRCYYIFGWWAFTTEVLVFIGGLLSHIAAGSGGWAAKMCIFRVPALHPVATV